MKQYVWNILISVDQMINTLLGGDPDETISSRASKAARGSGWWRLGRVLEAIDPGHLKAAREDDEGDDAVWK